MAGDKGELMRPSRRRLGRTLIGLAVLALSPAHAQVSDVPFVPTPPKVVDMMLGIAKVGPSDYVIDLGSGDGRIVIAAAKKYGARGLGVDIDSALVETARREAQRQGVSDKVSFANRNLFITDIRDATVITMYLYPQVIMQLRPRLLKELKPGTRIVSHEFTLDEWQPDAKVTVPVPDKPYGAPYSEVYLWIVPANATGKWRWRAPGAARDDEVTLEQTFQKLDGAGSVAGRAGRITDGRVTGEEVRFAFRPEDPGGVVHEFSGRLTGDALRGTVIARGETAVQREWQAVRVARGTMNINAGAHAARNMARAEEQR
ncbi:MAG: SAM-dependent methyltransferase [Betaproteobacteria bacterium]